MNEDLEPPPNALARKLRDAQVCTSMIVRISRGPEIGRIARACGFDALYVDLEHSPLSLDTTALVCLAAREAGVTPLVRLPSPTSDVVGRVLDAGAQGVIVPHVESVDDARRAARLTHYPPRGTRSFATGLAALDYRPSAAAEACRFLDRETLTIVMIESAAALAGAGAIAAVEGIDMLLVGAHDLAAALGIAGQLDDPRILDAFERVADACHRAGKFAGAGGVAGDPALLERVAAMGYRFMSTGSDVSFLMAGASRACAFVHSLGAGA